MIRCEAMRLAKIAVKAEIRDRGLRLKDYEMKEITALAAITKHRCLARPRSDCSVRILGVLHKNQRPVLQGFLLCRNQVRNDHRICQGQH
jgi:hypothetical protein